MWMRSSRRSLILTIGLDLLTDSYRQNGPLLHSTCRGPGTSASPSPPGKVELAPPAWARDRRQGWPCPRLQTVDPRSLRWDDWAVCGDSFVTNVRLLSMPGRSGRWVMWEGPWHRSPSRRGQPAHAGTCPTALPRSIDSPPQGSETRSKSQIRTSVPVANRPASLLPLYQQRPDRTPVSSRRRDPGTRHSMDLDSPTPLFPRVPLSQSVASTQRRPWLAHYWMSWVGEKNAWNIVSGMLDSSWVHLYMTLGLVGGAPTGTGVLWWW